MHNLQFKLDNFTWIKEKNLLSSKILNEESDLSFNITFHNKLLYIILNWHVRVSSDLELIK